MVCGVGPSLWQEKEEGQEMRLAALCMILASCSTAPLCDVERPDISPATYYRDSGEVVFQDTDYFKLKEYITGLEWCVN